MRISRRTDGASMVAVQQYIKSPHLIGGLKYDFRLYMVLVGPPDNMDVWLAREGLVRFCTLPYAEPEPGNFDELCMHLTNFRQTRAREAFSAQSKRLLSEVLKTLTGDGGAEPARRVSGILSVSPQPSVMPCGHAWQARAPQRVSAPLGSVGRCFCVIGIDIMMDHELQLHLMEINSSHFHGLLKGGSSVHTNLSTSNKVGLTGVLKLVEEYLERQDDVLLQDRRSSILL